MLATATQRAPATQRYWSSAELRRKSFVMEMPTRVEMRVPKKVLRGWPSGDSMTL